jgi:hypothetical protein
MSFRRSEATEKSQCHYIDPETSYNLLRALGSASGFHKQVIQLQLIKGLVKILDFAIDKGVKFTQLFFYCRGKFILYCYFLVGGFKIIECDKAVEVGQLIGEPDGEV